MGSTASRSRPHKVAPSNRLQQEVGPRRSQRVLPGLPGTPGKPSGSLGQTRTTLPPLKQEIPLSSLSGNLPQIPSSDSSIIRSHPPRRPLQALQPLASQIGHAGTASQVATGSRDGGVRPFSTTGQTGARGTGRMMQKGFLDAQTALSQQTQQHRRVHLRRAREQRRHRNVLKVNVGQPDIDGMYSHKLVRRPTERDVFWDEATGQSLDPRRLLESESPPLLRPTNQCIPRRGRGVMKGDQTPDAETKKR